MVSPVSLDQAGGGKACLIPILWQVSGRASASEFQDMQQAFDRIMSYRANRMLAHQLSGAEDVASARDFTNKEAARQAQRSGPGMLIEVPKRAKPFARVCRGADFHFKSRRCSTCSTTRCTCNCHWILLCALARPLSR